MMSLCTGYVCWAKSKEWPTKDDSNYFPVITMWFIDANAHTLGSALDSLSPANVSNGGHAA